MYANEVERKQLRHERFAYLSWAEPVLLGRPERVSRKRAYKILNETKLDMFICLYSQLSEILYFLIFKN